MFKAHTCDIFLYRFLWRLFKLLQHLHPSLFGSFLLHVAKKSGFGSFSRIPRQDMRVSVWDVRDARLNSAAAMPRSLEASKHRPTTDQWNCSNDQLVVCPFHRGTRLRTAFGADRSEGFQNGRFRSRRRQKNNPHLNMCFWERLGAECPPFAGLGKEIHQSNSSFLITFWLPCLDRTSAEESFNLVSR